MTKQIHPYVREHQQLYKHISRVTNYVSPRRRRSWWKAWHKREKAEQWKEKGEKNGENN